MKADFLKKRAKEFLEGANFHFGKGNYGAAAFNLEQAAQLLLKHYLFIKLKDFPKTHSLTQLLEDVGKAYQREKEVKRLMDQNINLIADLEQAYVTSRYLPAEFYKSQVEDMRRFVETLIQFLKSL